MALSSRWVFAVCAACRLGPRFASLARRAVRFCAACAALRWPLRPAWGLVAPFLLAVSCGAFSCVWWLPSFVSLLPSPFPLVLGGVF